MRLTRAHFATLRDFPADAEVISHKLMAKAGLIVKTGSGIYTYGPIFFRTLKKIMAIISEEMDRAGAQEMLMPILQPQELWERSGRLDAYVKAGILWRAKDRKDAWFALGPTHEEVIADFVDRTVASYKQLPLILYQQQDKFRDEIRPRFGLMRGREFMMKDAYSFDADEAGLDVSYRKMHDAYCRIFERCGLDFIVVQADSGDIGGSGSEEFMVTASSGEDAVLFCGKDGRSYAANVEKAVSRIDPPPVADPKPLRKEPTPGIKSVEQLVGFFPELTAARMVKTVLYSAVHRGETVPKTVAVLIRGDQEINETKLKNELGAVALDLADEETIRRVTNAEVGFAGPLGLKNEAGDGYTIEVLADESVRGMTNFLCGGNETDVHWLDVNVGRDLPEPRWADLRLARAGETCAFFDAPLQEARGIEVGHIFKLGTVYSAAMSATFLDENGKAKPFVMGCYGIGASRVAAAAIEQNHDERGIVWPAAIAPYHVALLALNVQKEEIRDVAERVYADLLARGVEVLYDDREKVSAGVKFKDAELLGLPWRIAVGRDAAEGNVEVTERRSGESSVRPAAEAVALVAEKLGEGDAPSVRFVDADA